EIPGTGVSNQLLFGHRQTFSFAPSNQIQLENKIQVPSLRAALMWPMRWITSPALGFLALCILINTLDAQIDRITGKNFATRSEVLARHGMVCTSVPAATQVGVGILK